MQDLINRLTNWKTTIIGIATAIVAVLMFFNLLKPDNDGVENITHLWDGILQVLAGISGIVLLFSKDSDTKEAPKDTEVNI